MSDLLTRLTELEAAASSRPWKADDTTLSAIERDVAEFYEPMLVGQASTRLAAFAVNHIGPALRALEAAGCEWGLPCEQLEKVEGADLTGVPCSRCAVLRNALSALEGE